MRLPDDPTWPCAQSKLTQFLVKSCGYNPKKDIVFVPISGLYGTNIKDPVEPKVAPWYRGGTLFSVRSHVWSGLVAVRSCRARNSGARVSQHAQTKAAVP